MEDHVNIRIPALTYPIAQRAAEAGFSASCDELTGNFLRMLAAAWKQANILELGTGAGYSTVWILEGMEETSRLTTVEMSEENSNIAREVLGHDMRVEFIVEDGGSFIEAHVNDKFDMIFADTWPGKFYLIDEVLNMVKPGGM